MNDALTKWLAGGERGVSSNTIVKHLTGLDTLPGWWMSHPRDPSDFGRCRKLLEQVPSIREEFDRMATCSPEWAALAARWDDLCELMDEEAPNWRDGIGSAPETYALMRALIDGAKA